MIAIPSIEVSAGRSLEGAQAGGVAAVPTGDPRDAARRWAGYGFSRIHVVDVDAARGRTANSSAIRALLGEGVAHVQVAGGLSTTEKLEQLVNDGASWVVVGSRALRDEDWLADITDRLPGEIIVALDVRDRRVVWSRTGGGERGQSRNAVDLVDDLERAHVELAGLLITSVDAVPRSSQGSLDLLEDMVEASPWPIIAGGADSLRALRSFEDRGVAAALLGSALYSGALDPHVVVEEFPT